MPQVQGHFLPRRARGCPLLGPRRIRMLGAWRKPGYRGHVTSHYDRPLWKRLR
jgi:hypothetical protein